MTRKDYQLIAQCIRARTEHQATDETYNEGWHAAVSAITHSLALALERDNPAFDRDTFRKACGIGTDTEAEQIAYGRAYIARHGLIRGTQS